MDRYWVWCGSVIKGEDGKYHMFASRWPKKFPFFNGYKLYSEIVRAEAEVPEGPYKFMEIVLGDRGESFWDGRMTHNPTIHKYGDNYLLFYIGTTFKGRKLDEQEIKDDKSHVLEEAYSNIRIGVAISNSVKGPFKRLDNPILQPRSHKWDNYIVTNPAPCICEDGSILLYYRSNTPKGLRIGVAKACSIEAEFKRLTDQPILDFDEGGHVEDPFVWKTDNGFELIAKDMTGGITGEKHAGVHAVSNNGINWRLYNPCKAYSRKVYWNNGEITIQGSLERPQLLFEAGKPTHLFAATADGPGGFDNASNTWNMVIPL